MTRFSAPRFPTIALAAIAALALPVAASAAPKTADEATSSFEQQPKTAKPQRYCVVDTVTGSRLAQRECKTLDAWLAQGFDPRVKK